MTEFVLSLLSRGYSHVVKTDGQYGRLDVCFEPEDYFNWKSQHPLLRLSQSGHLRSDVDPVPHKTYSTRKGPLILYSEDLALPSCQHSKVNRKGRNFMTSSQEEIQLHTLQDLTEAILAYDKKQLRGEAQQHLGLADKPGACVLHTHSLLKDKVGCQTSVIQPVLPVPKWAIQRLLSHRKVGKEFTGKKHHAFSSPQDISAYPRPTQEGYQPRFFYLPELHRPPPGPLPTIIQSPAPECNGIRPHPAPGKPVTSKTKGPAEQSTTRDRKTTFRTVVEIPRVQMSPIPEAESDVHVRWAEDHTVTVAAHRTGYPKDIGIQWKHSAIEKGGKDGAFCPKLDYMSPSLECSHLSGLTNYKRCVEGAGLHDSIKQSESEPHVRRVNTPPNPSFSICHLPPISQELPSGPNSKSHALKGGSTSRRNQKDSVPQLPDIRLPEASTGRTGPKPLERTLHTKVLVLLPSQVEQDCPHGPAEGSFYEDKAEREDVLCSDMQQRGKLETLEDGQKSKAAAEHDLLIWFEPEEDKEHQSCLGPLPPLVGCRGPGKQSSMAFYRQDIHDLADQTEPRSGIIRGSLPQELRVFPECQKGKALGTLIMGPAGEIIRLSFWDPLTDTQDLPLVNDGTRGAVLRVMSSDGTQEQQWTIMVEEEKITHTGEMSGSELKSKSGQKKEAGYEQEAFTLLMQSSHHMPVSKVSEDTAPAEHTKAVEKGEQMAADGTGTGDSQVCTLEKRLGKANRFTENQPHSKGEHTKIQAKGRTQELRAEGGGRQELPKSKSLSARHPQNTASTTPTVTEQTLNKETQKTYTELLKDTAKTQASKAGGEGGGEAEGTQVKNRKKKEEVNQKHTENKHQAKKAVSTSQSATDTQTQHIIASENTASDLVQKKKKTKAESEKPKADSSKLLRDNVKKEKKKTKGQAAFVVGKPRQTQGIRPIENESRSSERCTKTASSSEMNQLVGEPAYNCCGFPGHSPSADSASKSSEDNVAPVSPREVCVVLDSPRKHHKPSVYPREDPKAYGTPRDGRIASVSPREENSTSVSNSTDPRASVSSAEEPIALISPRNEHTAPDSFRSGLIISVSPREDHEASDSSRTNYAASGFSRMDHSASVSSRESHAASVSPRSYRSSSNSVTGRQNSQRTSIAAESERHNPVTLGHNQTSSQCSIRHSTSTLNKTESTVTIKGTDEAGSLKDKKAAALAEKAERRRLEVEKKRKKREEELKRQQEREDREEKMRLELEEEERLRVEQARLRKLKDEQERKRQAETEMERQRKEQTMLERERKVQEEKRRHLERLQREKQEEEKRKAEIKRQQLEEEEKMEEERRKLLEMEESERVAYLTRKREEEEKRQKAAEERRRADEEAAIQAEAEARMLAELFSRQRAALEQQLHFHRGLFVEAEGLEQAQDVSRPWVFSYFHLLKLLGMEESASDRMVKEVL